MSKGYVVYIDNSETKIKQFSMGTEMKDWIAQFSLSNQHNSDCSIDAVFWGELRFYDSIIELELDRNLPEFADEELAVTGEAVTGETMPSCGGYDGTFFP